MASAWLMASKCSRIDLPEIVTPSFTTSSVSCRVSLYAVAFVGVFDIVGFLNLFKGFNRQGAQARKPCFERVAFLQKSCYFRGHTLLYFGV